MRPINLVMTRTHKQLINSVRFQLSLLRLAVVPHGLRCPEDGADAALELAKLAEKIPNTTRKRSRATK